MKIMGSFLFIAVLVIQGCIHDQEASYPKRIGDIAHDPAIDHPDFAACDEHKILQHYATPDLWFDVYEGDKPALLEDIYHQFTPTTDSTQDGYFTVRMVINCEGKSGRYRSESMDLQYQPFAFDTTISDQILHIIRSLDGWKPQIHDTESYDYYIYITCKIINGNIVKVLP